MVDVCYHVGQTQKYEYVAFLVAVAGSEGRARMWGRTCRKKVPIVPGHAETTLLSNLR
jgi:hypothetical protein